MYFPSKLGSFDGIRVVCIIENISAPNLLIELGAGFNIKVDGLLYWVSSRLSFSDAWFKRSVLISSGKLFKKDSSKSWAKVMTGKNINNTKDLISDLFIFYLFVIFC